MIKKNSESIKPGYKMTQLGLIPENWEVKRLSSFAKIQAGATPSTTNPEYWGGKIRWMNSGELNFKKIYEVANRITEKGLKSSSTKVLPVNCVLIGLAGQGKTRGTVAINKVQLCTNQSIAAILPNECFEPEYIYYNLDSRYKELRQLSIGDGGRGGLNLKLIGSLELPLPPISEQKEIVKVISTWDEAIEKNQQLIEQKELRKKALMQQLLTGKKRLKGFSGEWKSFKLIDIFDRVTRKNDENNINVVTVSAQRGFIKQDDFFNKIVASETLDNYWLLEHGEFCYNKSYSNGYPWGATKRLNDFDKAVVTTLYICFGLKKNSLHSGNFFEYFFDANMIDKGLTKIAHEGGRAHGLLNVTPSDFFNLEIKIPSPEEQLAIADIIGCSYKDLQYSKNKLTALIDQKKAIMQVLLTGKKRIIGDVNGN